MEPSIDTVISGVAQILLFDIDDECIVYPGKNGIPAIVMPVPGNPIPRTKGQVADSVVQELRNLGLIDQNCTITNRGREYCQTFKERR